MCCGEGRDQVEFLLVVSPFNYRCLWGRDFFSPDSFIASPRVSDEGWDGEGCIPLVFGGSGRAPVRPCCACSWLLEDFQALLGHFVSLLEGGQAVVRGFTLF